MKIASTLLSSVSALVILSLPTLACAQNSAEGEPNATLPADVATSQPSKSGDNGEINVTGSRLCSGMRAPTPLAIVSADQLRTASPQQVGVALNQLPMFKGPTGLANPTRTIVYRSTNPQLYDILGRLIRRRCDAEFLMFAQGTTHAANCYRPSVAT